jgi:cysteine desulfurase
MNPVLAYLDHAATTPLRPEALSAMLPYLGEQFGNPSGSHAMARAARQGLEDARDSLAGHLGCLPGELVFTSGGTEAANLAVLGAAKATGRRPLCSAIEHHAVLRATLAASGTTVPVLSEGVVDLGGLESALAPDVGVLSVMLVNNEIGTLQPLDAVAGMLHDRFPGVLLHTDAVQAAGFLDLATATRHADLVSLSGHKFGGPKGIGALIVRAGTPLQAILFGGGQERDRRPGTPDVAGAVGMAAAFSAVCATRESEMRRVRELRDRLADGLCDAVPGAIETGVPAGAPGTSSRTGIAPGICHVRFPGVDQQELLVLLDAAGVCASAGAACASGAVEPSHVLLAMGLTASEARSAVRFSLGSSTTRAEVEAALRVVPGAVAQLRGSPRSVGDQPGR